jgi:exosortase/archaeosortase family protein
MSKSNYLHTAWKSKELVFLYRFSISFMLLYSFNIAFIGITTKGGYYIANLDNHLNYINYWRTFTIESTGNLLELLGYTVIESNFSLRVLQHSGFKLIYSCMGYGMMSLLAAFVLSYPSPLLKKAILLLTGLILIQGLNILRLMFLSLAENTTTLAFSYHHLIYNTCIYFILLTLIYVWTRISKAKYTSR